MSGAAAGPFTAVILAAGRGPDDPVAAAEGVSHKCLVDIGGKPMLQRVIDALAGAASVGRIVVCIDDRAVLAAVAGHDDVVASTATPGLSVLRAVEAPGSAWPLLITTADHALLTSDLVDAFCAQSLAADADVTAGLAAAAVVRAGYPEARRTYLPFRDGGYSGCNLFALLNENGVGAVRFWRRVERHRKRPWRLIAVFGPQALLLFALRRLTLDQAFARASQRFGARAKAVRLTVPEAAIDVDKPADLALARRVWASRAAG